MVTPPKTKAPEPMDAPRPMRQRSIFQLPASVAAVLADLERQRNTKSWVFHPELDREIALFRNRVEQQRAEAARQASLGKLQVELDLLDDWKASLFPLLQRHDYDAAAAAFQAKLGELTLPQSRQFAERVQEGLTLLGDLKAFLIESFPSTPFRQAERELGGDVISANESTLIIQIGGGIGQMERSWTQVPPGVYMQMAEVCLAVPRLDARRRSDMSLATAFYAYSMGGFPRAAAYAQQAVNLHPENADRVRRLMPGIIPD